MKTKLFLLMAIVLFACSTAKAYDAEIDGIYYNFYGDEAEVTYKNTSFNSYSGDIVIPESFIYNKKTYSVTSIGEEAFADCYSLASANIPNSVTSIGGYAFYGCVGLTSVNIPNSVTSIGESAFADCTGLTTISISKSIYNINTGVFYGCSSLSSVIIPDGITSIGVNAFSGCSSLNSISIPKSIKTIGPAFHYCNNLSDVYCFAQSVPVSLFESNPFFNSSINSATLHVPYGCKAAYEAASPWNEFGTIVEMEPENPIISFADAKVKALCVANWDTNSDGELDEAEATAVTDLGTVFKGNTEITSFNELQYFTGLTSIEDYAFQSCYNLTSVNIPNSVTSIGSSAFAVCYGLTSVNIGNSVTSIGDHAFFDCPGLTSITIPNSVTSIGWGVFEECSGLTSVTIGNSVTSIGDEAFFYCSRLTSVTIGNSVTSIGNSAFVGCSSLTSVNIPNSVTSIGSHAFAGCRGLTSVTIPNSVTSIGYNAFLDCSGLTSVTIGNSVTSIGDNAFSGCDGLTTINVEAGNTVYDSRNNCNAIIETATNTLIQGCKNTIIPNSVTSIGYMAFAYCSGLTSVNIGNSVKSIKYHAFAGCKELTDVYCLAENVPETSNDSFDDTPLNYATLHVPYGCKAAYEAASPWNEFGTIVEMEPENPIISFADAKVKALCVANWDTNSDGELNEAEAAAVTDLGTVFKGNTEITSFNELQYFTGVKAIGEMAFAACSNLASIAIPSSLTAVKKGAFRDCQSLSKVIVSDIAAWCGIIYEGDDYNGDFPLGIAHHLYSDEDTEITELVIPEGVTKIEARTFRDAQYITSVTIPNSVTTIEAEAFRGMTRLTSLTIPNKVKTIGDNAFFDCSGLVSIFIGSGVESIGSEAFRNCNRDQNLTSITVADENIYYDSRNNCNAIIETVSDKLILGCTNTTIPEGIKSIGILSLQWCGFASINIPSSVTSIEADAMSHCPNLTSIDIPAGVSKIEGFTFYGCKSLTSITIPSSVTKIEERAFNNCNSLSDVYCLVKTVPTTSNNVFENSSIGLATLHVPYESIADYESTTPWNGFKEIDGIITIGSTGFATFCSPYALNFSEVEDIRAYIVSGFNQETGTLVLTRVTEVPAGEGLYIAGMPGNHEIPQTKTSMFYANLLKGVTEPTIISPTDGNYTNYILSNGSYGVGFYTLSQTGTLDAGKAYLQLPTASVAGIKALKIEFDENDDPTGIAITSTSPTEENTIYNLAGQRMNKAQKGVNIVNGKKVFIK